MNIAPTEEEIKESLDRMENVLRHIENVRDNCIMLGKKLMADGELLLGRQIIAQGLRHDNSKLHGLEWERLHPDTAKTKLEAAILQHNTSPDNAHHPEAWAGGIEEMSRAFLGEMVCDWASRAAEFGSSLREWVDEGAAKRFGYKKGDKIHKQLTEFVDMICDKPFKQK